MLVCPLDFKSRARGFGKYRSEAESPFLSLVSGPSTHYTEGHKDAPNDTPMDTNMDTRRHARQAMAPKS